jgi:hypothetical protein
MATDTLDEGESPSLLQGESAISDSIAPAASASDGFAACGLP